MYLNTDWPRYLLDGGFCNYSMNSPNWHFGYILSMVPTFLCYVDAHAKLQSQALNSLTINITYNFCFTLLVLMWLCAVRYMHRFIHSNVGFVGLLTRKIVLIFKKILLIKVDWSRSSQSLKPKSSWVIERLTRSQAVARIADRTAKNCSGHVT